MTDFDPIKKRIWESAKADDKDSFDKNCEALFVGAVEVAIREVIDSHIRKEQ